MLDGSRDQVLLIKDLPALVTLKSQRAGNMPPAFLQALAKAGRASGLPVEVRLEVIVYPIEKIHGPDGLTGGDHSLHISHLFEMEGRNSGGKDAPVDGISKGLFGGKRKTWRWRKQRSGRLRAPRQQRRRQKTCDFREGPRKPDQSQLT